MNSTQSYYPPEFVSSLLLEKFGYSLLFALWLSSFDKNKLVSDKSISKLKISPFRKFSQYPGVMLLLNIALALSIIPAAVEHYVEYTRLFSGSKEMARYLESNNLTTNIIVAHRSPHASAILPYLPGIKFWYADIEQYGTYVIWNKKYGENQKISFEEIGNRINKHHISKSNILILLNNPMPISKVSNYRLLKKVEDNVFGYGDERFYLYRQL